MRAALLTRLACLAGLIVAPTPETPKIKHLFLIVLENNGTIATPSICDPAEARVGVTGRRQGLR
jgi:hypothetical protein